MRINTNLIVRWNVASKTRPIKAKPLVNLIVDRTIVSKFLVDTLEGKEPLGDGVVICVGEAGDAWQQMPNKLLKKYSVKDIDKNGWMICEPLPDNAVDCVEVKEEKFTIVGLYGQTVNGEANVQSGVAGDFICRNQTDHKDVWIVNRKMFVNTYVIKS